MIINVHWLFSPYHACALEILSHFILSTDYEVGAVVVLILLAHLREYKDSDQGHAASVVKPAAESPLLTLRCLHRLNCNSLKLNHRD